MLSFAQDYEQCRTAFLRETEYKNVEGLRDDLYYACILFGTGTPEYRAVGNAVLENANWHACPYSGLPAVQLLTEHGDMLSAGAREKLLSFLRQGQAGWCAELKKSKWNSFALLAAVSVLGVRSGIRGKQRRSAGQLCSDCTGAPHAGTKPAG